ncbi:hypothetical protein [Sulfurifustis variabilis]|uniref:hypothetical protein n=1 Tax=Sulfurifustis variabilis TaxID=1675686 RepID=UPI001474E8A6|nr:hypothetical protein [Sulfurifustis variabilis]
MFFRLIERWVGGELCYSAAALWDPFLLPLNRLATFVIGNQDQSGTFPVRASVAPHFPFFVSPLSKTPERVGP